ncbi:hypothetical protein [Brevundimonas sp.]|uniref:hypothetical protein n=1 Tax=Brevundimonas sp. TaxID=1871086 RepID=UPI002FC7D342
MAAYVVAWLWGGRTERFVAATMLLHFAISVTSIAYEWPEAGLHLPRQIADYVRLLIFGWLCFRSNRWWPFLMAVGLGLSALVDVVVVFDPGISPNGAVSAKIGLAYLFDLTLLLSVCERWLAGEPPAGRAAWARADIATAARRNRRKPAPCPEATPGDDTAKAAIA